MVPQHRSTKNQSTPCVSAECFCLPLIRSLVLWGHTGKDLRLCLLKLIVPGCFEKLQNRLQSPSAQRASVVRPLPHPSSEASPMSRESGLVAFSGSFNVLNADGIYDRDRSDARAVNAAHLATVADGLLATRLDFDQLLARRDLHRGLLAFDAIHH